MTKEKSDLIDRAILILIVACRRQNQINFPILYCIATMILSTTPKSVPSEKLFSDAGNNLYDKRKRMTAECFYMKI